MNRREMLQQTMAALSAIGVVCDLTIESLEPKPALIVLKLRGPCPHDRCSEVWRLVGELMTFIGGDIPAIILPENDDLKLMSREEAIAFLRELEVVRYRIEAT